MHGSDAVHTPHDIVFGRPLPGILDQRPLAVEDESQACAEWFQKQTEVCENLRALMEKRNQKREASLNKKAPALPCFVENDLVWWLPHEEATNATKLAPKRHGPCKVVEKISDLKCVRRGRVFAVS